MSMFLRLASPGRAALAALAAAALLPGAAQAARFANQFAEFELPPQWQCNLEGAEWVCQSTDEAKRRDAIIVLAAKLKGDQDSLEQYLAYLKGSKSYVSIQGKPVKSEVKYAKYAQVNQHSWADALHQDSEIPGFYTRYLATVKLDIGVLVTYSINKAKYSQYLGDFENMVKTLKVFRKPGAINTKDKKDDLFNTSIPAQLSEASVFQGASPEGGADQQKQEPPKDELPMELLLLGAAVVGFILWKKKRGG
jgi:hypothetical protein